jgi:hypothetical protein
VRGVLAAHRVTETIDTCGHGQQAAGEELATPQPPEPEPGLKTEPEPEPESPSEPSQPGAMQVASEEDEETPNQAASRGAHKLQTKVWTTAQDGVCARRVLYVGDRDSFVMCSMMLKQTTTAFYSYDPEQHSKVREESWAVNRALRGRYFCVEKAKEAQVC